MPGSIQSLQRAAAILQLVAERSSPPGLTDVAASLDLAKATAYGLLHTLQEVGFLVQDDAGRYTIGSGLTGLTEARVDPNDLRSHAMNWADTLASRSGESVRVGAWVDGEVRTVHHVFRPDDTFQQSEVGAPVPVHATALGKVLLAWGGFPGGRPDKAFDQFTQRTITSPGDLSRRLVDVRREGWACDVEEHHPGEATVAAPLRAVGSRVIGALGIVGPVDRICDAAGHPRAQLLALVCDTAQSISRDLVTARR